MRPGGFESLSLRHRVYGFTCIHDSEYCAGRSNHRAERESEIHLNEIIVTPEVIIGVQTWARLRNAMIHGQAALSYRSRVIDERDYRFTRSDAQMLPARV